MQKVYQRINWENDPSTNTPLSEDNLNKMDYALYELDKRVLTLGGYEERAALSATNAETSEINAKTSENNSKVSETNAKTSEINAKDYMERAYATTPEGYDELVETVRLMDIATTTESILEKSKPGGLKINHIKGATEQNGTPTPSSPIGIKNVGDCVEIINGNRNITNGTLATSDLSVCNKVLVPCKSGDIVKIKCDKTHTYIYSILFNDSTFVSGAYKDNVSEYEFTIPSGVNLFGFNISNTNGVTPQTVGKLSLTVNGKYVTPIKSHGKNLLDCSGLVETTKNGVTFTPVYDTNGNLLYINVNGTATAEVWFALNNSYKTSQGLGLTLNKSYSLYHDSKEVFKECYFYLSSGNSTNFPNYAGEMETLFTPTLAGATYCPMIYVLSGKTVTNFKIYPMISEIGGDYEPYQETTAYIYTDEPIRDSDVVFKDNGVWKVERKEGLYQLSGTETFTYNETYGFFETNGLSLNTNAWETNVRCTHLQPFPNVGGIDKYNWTQFNASKNIRLKVEGVTSVSDLTTWLSNNNVFIEYPLATPTYETLDTASQIALNSLETFDTVTYIEVDSRVQPSEIEVEYGTSKVGGYSLEALRNSKNNEKAIEENMKAITSGEVVVEYESEDDFAGRSWINVVTLMAGEKLKNILNMISAMFNNIRFLRNEVNKKMDANYGYLTEGDLNNIIYESGKAYCTTNVANIPIMERGWLEVLMSDDADMVLQRYTTAVGNKVFIRRLVKSTSNGWGEWSKCNLTSDDIVVDMVAKPATMNLPAWASVSIEIESKYLSLEYELLSANVYFVDDLSSGTLSDSNLCVDQVMTSTNTASAHCCVAKVRNASSSQINKGCYSVARFVLVKK